jgi:hypothetical protein
MRQFLLTLRSQEPLILSDGSSETMAHRTLNYIPGNMILGAMSERWRDLNHHRSGRPDDDPDFQALFLDGSVSWGHAYPLVGQAMALPIPISFFRIKSGKDLPVFGSNDLGHESRFIVNYLNWRGEIKDLEELSGQPRPKLKRCQAGFWDSQETKCRPDQRTRWAMHVALDPASRRAADGLLFGFSSLAEGGRFQSPVFVSENKVEEFQALMGQVKTFRVGHGRSAGYGSVVLESLTEAELAEPSLAQGQRLCRIFLESDYLAKNSWENPLASLLEELAPYVGQPMAADQVKIFAQPFKIVGFNNFWRLPRPTRTALVKGSVIEFLTNGPSAPDQPWPFFFGSDTIEGYGRVRLNPQFLEKDYFNEFSQTVRPEPTQEANEFSKTVENTLFLMRIKAIDREIQRIIIELLYSEDSKFHKFANGLGKSNISPSQLSKLRNEISTYPRDEWLGFFKSELKKKTVEKKWHQGSAPNPGSGPKRENLDVIMKFLLAGDFPANVLASQPENKALKLPNGATLTKEEQAYFNDKFHRDFLLQLLGVWRQKVREKS